MKKELIKIADKLIELEKLAQKDANYDYFAEMIELTKNLAISDMFEIDEYIQEKFLTK